MSYQNRQYASHLRHASLGGSQAASAQSPALAARIEEKKTELENLNELRELSAALATQMENLESKLSALANGTEGKVCSSESISISDSVSCCRCSFQLAKCSSCHQYGIRQVCEPVRRYISNGNPARIPKPKDEAGSSAASGDQEVALPQTLVRIPAGDQ